MVDDLRITGLPFQIADILLISAVTRKIAGRVEMGAWRLDTVGAYHSVIARQIKKY